MCFKYVYIKYESIYEYLRQKQQVDKKTLFTVLAILIFF